ncbi:MAG: hypothetical protein OIF38_15870 [Cellvibrionaceae bacterium]|nr:hypothetical protein [Cellvibrionaceae bacterium]
MKALFALSCALLLSACSQPQIHLHAQHLKPHQRQALMTALEPLQFTVTLRQNPLPAGLYGNTLVYSGSANLEPLQQLLSKLGYPLESQIHNRVGTHRYTDGNLGLYLMPPAATELTLDEQPYDPGVLQEYGSSGCSGAYVLDLSADNSLVLGHLKTDAPTINGRWQFAQSGQLQLDLGQGALPYRLDKRRYDEGSVWRHETRLVPLQHFEQSPLACIFANNIYELKETE